MKEEVVQKGVSISVIFQYIAAMGGALSLLCVLVSFLLPAAGTASAVWYLSYWLKQGSGVSLVSSFILVNCIGTLQLHGKHTEYSRDATMIYITQGT